MPRKIRIQFPGASYHIMSRGDKYAPIFHSDSDRHSFLKTLGEVCERTGWHIHAYVLMTNHYHLLVDTPEANLVDGMRWFQSTYTRRFNGRNHLVGHVFQGRYKSLIIDSREMDYFLTVSEYIHLNPVRAGLLDSKNPRLFRYRWSSFPYYLKKPDKRPSWLQVKKVFTGLKIPQDNTSGRKKYAQHMNLLVQEVLDPKNKAQFEQEWLNIRHGWFLGDGSFKDKLLDLTDRVMHGKTKSSFSGETKRLHDEHSAEELVQKAAQILNVDNAVLPAMKKSDPQKQVIAWLLKQKTSVSNAWIAERLSMGHYTAVTNAVRAVGENKQGTLKSLVGKIENFLK